MPKQTQFYFKNALRWSALSVFIALADQVSKFFVVTTLQYNTPMPIFTNLNLTLRYNAGAAYSFLHNAGGWQVYFLSTLSVITSLIIAAWLLRTPRTAAWRCFGLSLILGGAIGNLIDRLQLSYVVDFIDFYINSWHFATFNVADAAISIGAACLIKSLILDKPMH